MPKTCKEAERLLSQYLDGELSAEPGSAPERGELESHLASCASCRAALEAWSRIGLTAVDVLRQFIPEVARPGGADRRPQVVTQTAGERAAARRGWTPVRGRKDGSSGRGPAVEWDKPPTDQVTGRRERKRPESDRLSRLRGGRWTRLRYAMFGAAAAAAALFAFRYVRLARSRDARRAPVRTGPTRDLRAPVRTGPTRDLRALAAEIVEVGGSVRLVRSDGKPTDGVPAEAGGLVEPGETFRTGPGARARLRYRDGTEVLVGQKTVISLLPVGDGAVGTTTLSARPGKDGRGKGIAVAGGMIAATVSPQPEGRAMVLTTPHAEARILGTRLDLEVAEGSTRLEVTEGRVRLTRAHDGDSVIVTEGYYATAGKGIPLVATAIASATDAHPAIIRRSRMPVRPAWAFDLTDILVKLPESVTDPEAASNAEGIPLAEATSRDAEHRRRTVKGGPVLWKATFTVPDEVRPEQALVLELDESRIVTGVWLNGRKRRSRTAKDFDERYVQKGRPPRGTRLSSRPDNTVASLRWQGGEGIVHLPPLRGGERVDLAIACRDLTHLYPNGFGRVHIRPAELNECIGFKDLADENRVEVFNRTGVPRTVAVEVVHQDFFGVVLKRLSRQVALPAQEKAQVEIERPDHRDLWKTVVWAQAGDSKTFEHWHYHDMTRYNRVRPEVIRLRDGWECRHVAAQEGLSLPAPADGWKGVELPHGLTPGDRVHRAWFRRKVRVPAGWRDKRVQLFLQAVHHRVEVYVDGRRMGAKAQWELPGTVDLTEAIRPGSDHEILLGVTDFIVTLAPGKPEPPDGQFGTDMRSLVASGGGHGRGNPPSVPCVPEILAMPPVRTDWAFVRTRVTGRRRLEATIELRNDLPRRARAELVAKVFDRGKRVLDVARRTVSLPAGETKTLEVAKSWASPVLWTPENPHLYELRIELVDGNGAKLDVRRERFGFREIGIDGRFFALNGKRFKLYGSGHLGLYRSVWPMVGVPQRIVRHYFKRAEGYLDGGIDCTYIGDETGVFVKEENMQHNAHHSPRYAYHLDETWENLFSEMRAVFRSHPNTPSSFFWDVGNEVNYSGPGEAGKMGRLFARIREMDPTRLVTTGGSYPLPTGAEVLDTHDNTPPYDRGLWWFTHPEERPPYLKGTGCYAYRPRGEHPAAWSTATERIVAGAGYYRTVDGARDRLLHAGGRPVFFSESLNCDEDLYARFASQVAYRPYATGLRGWDQRMGLIRLGWSVGRRYMIQFHRQAETAGFMCHVDRAFTRAFSPVAVFPFNRRFRFERGEPVTMRFSVHNDRSRDERITVRWRVLDGGRQVDEKTKTLSVPAAAVRFHDVTLAVPDARMTGTYDLILEAWTESDRAYYDDWLRFSVFARAPLAVARGFELDVYDPGGQVSGYLQEEKVSFRRRDKLSAWPAGAKRFLLVGPDGLAKATPEELAGLAAKVSAGGRVVVLDHRDLPKFLSFPVTQTTDLADTCAVVDPHSALTKGLVQEDFRFWRTRHDDFAVYRDPLELPGRGGFRAHLVTYRRTTGFDRTPLLEVREGEGRAVFCQLNLGAALGRDPAARVMLGNLLAWPGTVERKQAAKTALVAVEDGVFLRDMRGRLGLDAEIVGGGERPRDWRQYGLIVTSGEDAGARELLRASQSSLLEALENGSRLVVLGLDEGGAAWLRELMVREEGREIGVEPFRHDRAYLVGFDPLLRGLTHSDFFWAGFENKPVNRSLPDARANQTGHFRLTGTGLRPLLDPAFLGALDLGRGQVVVSLVRSREYPIVKALRVLSMLLTNCGARLNPAGYADTEEEAQVWDFFLVDLRAHANRGFADRKGQKVRGWSAQGPDCDMSEFPVGRQTFRRVPFDIIDPARNGGRSVVALSGTTGKELPSEVKEIKVGRKAERLVFVHASAWGAAGFTYRIWYEEDRRKWVPTMPDPFVLVRVKPDESISDWYQAEAYAKGERVLAGAQVAWTGYTRHSRSIGRKVGVYMMTWDNPHPEKIIDAVDILSPGEEGAGQPLVIAITGAVRSAGRTGNPEQRPFVMPDGVRKEEVFRHYRGSRYGAVVLKDGTIPVIHDAQGKVLFRNAARWSAQGVVPGGVGRRPRFTQIESQRGQKNVRIAESREGGGSLILEIRNARSGYFVWSQRVVFRPSSVLVRYDLAIVRPFPTGTSTNVLLGIDLSPGAMAGKIDHAPNTRPIVLPLQGGIAAVRYDSRLKWHGGPGYWVRNSNIGFSLFREETKVPGNEDGIWYEIQMP